MVKLTRIARHLRQTCQWSVLAGAILISISLAAAASICVPNQERNIVDAILNQSYSDSDEIDSVISQLDISNALIPEPEFYRALAIWYRGYQNENLAWKKKGIQQLQEVVQAAEEKYQSDTVTNHLIVGVIKAYTARALFENEQIVKGYYTGIDAVNRLDQFLTAAIKDTPGYHDARFLMGLYSIYTHDLETRTHWLIGTVKSVGSKSQSIRDIHQAIRSNALFASESVRSFFAEVNWRTPDICNYRDLARSTQGALSNNLDLALLTQGIFLKCGDAEVALVINNQFHSRTDLPRSVKQKILKARLRIHADRADTTAIARLNLPDSLNPYRTLAMANALDIAASRSDAIEKYQALIDNTEISEQIKRAATVRLTYPYRQPKQIPASDKHTDLRVCQSG